MSLKAPAELLKLFSIESRLEETLLNEVSRNDVHGVTSLRERANTICCDFYGCKNDNFHMKKCDIFFSFLLNT